MRPLDAHITLDLGSQANSTTDVWCVDDLANLQDGALQPGLTSSLAIAAEVCPQLV